MDKQLNMAQKKKIDELLRSNRRTPAEETISETIRKSLRLSRGSYRELKNEIADYVEKFFKNLE